LYIRQLIRGGKSDKELEAAILQALANKPGEHHFAEEFVADREEKSMFQIGG
jgi:cyclic pyranopterin phosphate synthase